jgi:predicted protein tyrosine phosphatase
VVLRPDFRRERLNLYFRDLTDGVGIATEADIEKTCKFSAKWARAARKDPEKAPLVVHCAAGISRSTAIAMIPLIADDAHVKTAQAHGCAPCFYGPHPVRAGTRAEVFPLTNM